MLASLPARVRPGPASLEARPELFATVRLAILAGCISAAKVALFAIGGSAFLTAHGAGGLAWFYVVLALLASSTAILVAPHLERGCCVTAMLILLTATAALSVMAGAMLAASVPGAGAALLMVAHIYNIGSEILLWVIAATWLRPPDLRRATVWIYLATALGGFVGGIGAERLLVLGPAAACVLVTLIGTGYGGIWLRRSLALPGRGSVWPIPEPAAEMEAPEAGGKRSGLLAHPLAPLLGASSFMLTLVWGMTEFLCFAVYEQRFDDPAALTRFLAALYAFQQLVEFGCIALLTGPVTRRLSPLARSILFPLGSLLTLLAMGRGFSLPATVLAHSHTEAVSNALFDPVHAANFAAVPHRLQARVRSVSEGICYPLGMAAGGLVLMGGAGEADLDLVLLATAGAACLFLAVGVFTGIMVTPSLLAQLGLTAELGPSPRRSELRVARRALVPWARRTRLRQRLLAARSGADRPPWLERRMALANRRALAEVFEHAKRCDPEGSMLPQLELMLDSRDPELRALAAETVLSLPVRPLFLDLMPALRSCYLA